MQRTTAPNSSAGLYVDEVPGSVVGTTDQAADKNMTQEELCNAVTNNNAAQGWAGITLTSAYADKTQLWQFIVKTAIEHSHYLGELFYELDYLAPVAFSAATPHSYRPALCIDNSPIGTPITITDAHWPLLGPYLRGFKTAYREGVSTQNQWSAITGVVNANIVTLTLANNAGENALLKALAEDELVHGAWTSWLTVTVVSNFSIGAVTVNAGTYTIVQDSVNNSNLGVDPVARKISFSYTAANQGSTACTGTLEIHPFSIAGSSTTAQLLSGAGRTLMSPNDANDEEMPGLRRRDRMTSHLHSTSPSQGNGVWANVGATKTDLSAGSTSSAIALAVGSPTTDAANGQNPLNSGKTTDPRMMTAHLYIHGGQYLP